MLFHFLNAKTTENHFHTIQKMSKIWLNYERCFKPTKSPLLMFTETLHRHVKSAQKYLSWKYHNSYLCLK